MDPYGTHFQTRKREANALDKVPMERILDRMTEKHCIHDEMMHKHFYFLIELIEECLGKTEGKEAHTRIEAGPH